jgi:hypothetical protein
MSEERTKLNESNGYAWRDLGDGVPVMVKVCSMCGVSPSAPDDCGMPTVECPNFGKDACARERKRWEDAFKHNDWPMYKLEGEPTLSDNE